jgi:hypothetical protein
MFDKTAANRGWTLPVAWWACISEAFLCFVRGVIPVPIVGVQRKRYRFARRRARNMTLMTRHIGGLRRCAAIRRILPTTELCVTSKTPCNILHALIVDPECDDRQLPTTDRAWGCRPRRRFVERQHPQTVANAPQSSCAKSDAAV